MAKMNACIQSCFVKPLMRNTSGTITSMKRIMSQVNLPMPFSKLVVTRTAAMDRANVPK